MRFDTQLTTSKDMMTVLLFGNIFQNVAKHHFPDWGQSSLRSSFYTMKSRPVSNMFGFLPDREIPPSVDPPKACLMMVDDDDDRGNSMMLDDDQ